MAVCVRILVHVCVIYCMTCLVAVFSKGQNHSQISCFLVVFEKCGHGSTCTIPAAKAVNRLNLTGLHCCLLYPKFLSTDKARSIGAVERTGIRPADASRAEPVSLEAFLVVSGCVRDYPIDLVTFIRSARLNPLQVASFLGEDAGAEA